MTAWILVVEDDASTRRLLTTYLADSGYGVVAAEHGAAALEILRTSQTLPGLVLLDLWMPVMDGWTFRRLQRGDSRLRQLPIVILTTFPLSARELHTLGAPALGKPFSLEALGALIAGYVEDDCPDRALCVGWNRA